MYNKYFKRIFDIVFSLILLPFVIIIIVVVSPFIYFEDKGSILYIAKRRGKNGKVFNMYKLRTMKMNAPDIRNEDNSTYNSKDDVRVTKVGKILRSTSIDELPQIINIFKGDMSWVGPRPVTIDKPMKDYDKKRLERLKVRPGITGYAQAYYRNNIGQEEKLELDAAYANNVTLRKDVQIVIKTIKSVLHRDNIYNS